MKQRVFQGKFSTLEDQIKYCGKCKTVIDQNDPFLHGPIFLETRCVPKTVLETKIFKRF